MSTTFRLTDTKGATHPCVMNTKGRSMGIFTLADDKCIAVAKVGAVDGQIVVATHDHDPRFDPTTIDSEMEAILQRAA